MVRKREEQSPIIIHDDKGGVLAEYPPDLVETIKATVAKDASDEELYMFLSVANQYNLNPFMKEIWFTKMNNQVSIMTSRDGYRKLAMREPTFKKCQSWAVFENDEFEMELVMGEIVNLTHKFKQNDRGQIKGAYAILKTTDHDNLAVYVDFREYDRKNQAWKKYPTAMIRKVAENDVYSRFVDINGLNAFENMPNGFYDDEIDDGLNELDDTSNVINTNYKEIEEE